MLTSCFTEKVSLTSCLVSQSFFLHRLKIPKNFRYNIFHPSSGGNPALKGRVFQNTVWAEFETRSKPTQSRALRPGFIASSYGRRGELMWQSRNRSRGA